MNNENRELCSKCGGRCCKNLPGIYSPQDLFGNIPIKKENIKSLVMETDYLSIDKWEADEEYNKELYYLRPKVVKSSETISLPDIFKSTLKIVSDMMNTDPQRKVHFAYPIPGYVCYFLGKDGCKLSYDKRPQNCRDLVPKENGFCYCEKANELDITEKLYYAKLWEPYSDMIKSVADDIIYGEDFEDYVETEE